ncbi:MAG: hypothetical protein ACOYBM_03520 [Dethiobacteria bacterium]|jgi:hypothetical protein|nr:hypothetical protein [Bacillota bacterium]
MGKTPNNPFFDQFEKSIKKIKDIKAVNIVGSEDNDSIEEIHVLAEKKRTAKQIVRDIETLFKVKFGRDIDHKKVSVLQFGEDLKINNIPRLKFNSLALYRSSNRLEIKVELITPSGQCIAGEAVGLNSRTNRLRMVAEATVRAVEKVFDESLRLTASVENVNLFSLGGSRVAIAIIALIGEKENQQLVGSALVQDDENESVIRAVLDALNRYVEKNFIT